jgi:hypothetical protein
MAKAKATARPRSGKRRSDARRTDVTPQAADDVRLLARDAALAALTRLTELAKSEDERVALAASQELLNRAFGKSVSAAPEDQGNAAQPLVIKIVRFGAEENDEPRTTSDRASRAKP